MTRITKLSLAALVGLSALPFGSCKSEVDKAGKAVNETMDKAKKQTGRAMEKTGAAIKEAGEKMQEKRKNRNEVMKTTIAWAFQPWFPRHRQLRCGIRSRFLN